MTILEVTGNGHGSFRSLDTAAASCSSSSSSSSNSSSSSSGGGGGGGGGGRGGGGQFKTFVGAAEFSFDIVLPMPGYQVFDYGRHFSQYLLPGFSFCDGLQKYVHSFG